MFSGDVRHFMALDKTIKLWNTNTTVPPLDYYSAPWKYDFQDHPFYGWWTSEWWEPVNESSDQASI
jgi:hypothetical protein